MRSFKPGENVKVNLADEGKPARWVPAVYRGTLTPETALPDDGSRPHLVYVGEIGDRDTRRVPDDRIMGYKPVHPDEVIANGVKHAPAIIDAIKKAMVDLLPPNMRCEVTGGGVEDDGIITLVNTDLTIDPSVIEVMSIIGSTEVAGWVVTRWTTVSGYPHAPDDVQDAALCEARTPHDTARLAVGELWKLNADHYFQRQDEDAWAQAMIADGIADPEPK